MTLDQIDVRILGELQANARISISVLAERVALTPTPCARRVQLLEGAGYIQGYVAVLGQSQLGLPVDAFAEVRLVREGKKEVAQFESAVARRSEVMQCWAMSGRYDYLLHVVTSDLAEYNRFLRDQLLNLGCVDHVETSFALQRIMGRTALPLDHLKVPARQP
jgi:Lrp/AsnC family transcriptional regulator, leucine-responsive regulatory protein